MSLTVVLLALTASARQASNDGFGCTIDKVYEGAQRQLMEQASRDNSTMYGAVGTLERVVLPGMKDNPDLFLMTFEQHVLAGVLRVPAAASGDCAHLLLDAPVDLASSNWGLAWSNDDFGVFYNASVTHAQAYGGGAW